MSTLHVAVFIHERIRKQATTRPDHEALVCGDTRLTYSQFNSAVDSVAGYLQSQGVQKGDRVFVSLEKSAEYVCILMGISRAGAVYVPIDWEYPASRVQQIVEECEMKHGFANAAVVEKCAAALPSVQSICVVGEQTALTSSPFEITPYSQLLLTHPEVTPVPLSHDDLMYILYTSGSTGRPKGVMLTHGNIIHFMHWCEKEFSFLDENDVILNTAPFTFDISGLDMFNAFHVGAKLVVVANQRMINTVLAAIHKERVTFVSTVPTVLGAMIERPRIFTRYDFSSVHTFISGAALCPTRFMIEFHKHVPAARLYNIYGPTEATIYCLYHPIDPEILQEDIPLPIGIPFENTNAYVLDENGNECPPGVEGELILRGPLVAKGYFKNPEKTSEAFRPFPLEENSQELVYFTGDVAKQDDNGIFWFLGRKDDLVKSSGYRIELNEIEIALSSLADDLAEFSVVAVPDPLVENRIYACVVLKANSSQTPEGITKHCQEKLPPYMLPEKIFVLESLPKTSSGKLSRKDLRTWILQQAQ